MGPSRNCSGRTQEAPEWGRQRERNQLSQAHQQQEECELDPTGGGSVFYLYKSFPKLQNLTKMTEIYFEKDRKHRTREKWKRDNIHNSLEARQQMDKKCAVWQGGEWGKGTLRLGGGSRNKPFLRDSPEPLELVRAGVPRGAQGERAGFTHRRI